jgi:hypothetical protein
VTNDDLKALSARLVALHAALVEYQRQDYEERYGPTKPAELLRLLIDDAHFAWLRPLSRVIAEIDEALDPRAAAANRGNAPAAVDVGRFFQAAERLLRSGEIGAFETKYREALQRSPELIMTHADVVKILSPRA